MTVGIFEHFSLGFFLNAFFLGLSKMQVCMTTKNVYYRTDYRFTNAKIDFTSSATSFLNEGLARNMDFFEKLTLHDAFDRFVILEKCDLFSHCSKSSFFVQKFNFDNPRKLSIFWDEKLVKNS